MIIFWHEPKLTDILFMVQVFTPGICNEDLLCAKHSEGHKDEFFQYVKAK